MCECGFFATDVPILHGVVIAILVGELYNIYLIPVIKDQAQIKGKKNHQNNNTLNAGVAFKGKNNSLAPKTSLKSKTSLAPKSD